MLALLDVTFSLEDWYQYTLSPNRWHLFRIFDAVEQITSNLYPKLPIHFHALVGISSAPIAFSYVMPLRALSVSSSLMFRVITCWGLFLMFQLSGFP